METTASEFNEASGHTYIPMELAMEIPMQKPDYSQINMYRDGVKIRLEFPSKIEEEETIKNDVRNILTSALQEQMQMKM